MSNSPLRTVSADRVALFIDGPNFFSAVKYLGIDIDYAKLRDHLRDNGRLVRASYYTAVPEEGEYSPTKPLLDYLSGNGFVTRTKTMKMVEDDQGRRKIKGSMVTQMVVDMMEMIGTLDQMILFSGDGEFTPVVEAAQRRGVRVVVVSTEQSISDDLRRQADDFVDLADLAPLIERDRNTIERHARVQRPITDRTLRLRA